MPARKSVIVGPSCGKVQEKCIYVSLLAQLISDQAAGKPGSLGPVEAFKGEQFFSEFTHATISIRTILEGPARLKGFGAIVAFGDIHGDLLSLLGVLHAAGCIDDTAHWCPQKDSKAPKRCVVQLGDLLDRGGRGSATVDTSRSPREEINLIEYIHALDGEAQKFGERVLSISGNHEEMALRSAFDSNLARHWNFTTEPTACPFPDQKRTRHDIFATKGALRYFAIHRPPMAVSSLGWVFAHGDVPIDPLRKFVTESHAKMLSRIRAQSDLSQSEAIVGATNLLWVAYVLELGGDLDFTNMLRKMLPQDEREKGFPAGALSAFPTAVSTCRTLARMGKKGGEPCDCDGRVDEVGRILGFDWAVSGGIALGHTVNASISTQCGGKVQLLDVGMSEAFRGFNTEGKVAFLRVTVSQTLEQEERDGK